MASMWTWMKLEDEHFTSEFKHLNFGLKTTSNSTFDLTWSPI